MSAVAPVPDELLSGIEVAKRLKLHPVTVRIMARDGALPAVKVGGDWRFDWPEVLRHLKAVGSNQPKEGAQE